MTWTIKLSSSAKADAAKARAFAGKPHSNYELELPSDKIIGIVGPSGSGKTSFLRRIAGLEKTPNSHVQLGKQVFQQPGRSIPVYQRGLGFVFQGNNLFPHKSVRKNLTFALKHAQQRTTILEPEEIISTLGIEQWIDRKPHQLSGGQQQLVTIARSLMSQPQALLLDEAFNGLDSSKKSSAIELIRKYHRISNNSVFFVTHHLNELMQLADEVMQIDNGQVINQCLVADFPNQINQKELFSNAQVALLSAQFETHESNYGLWKLDVDGQSVWVPAEEEKPQTHGALRVVIDAHSVSVSKTLTEDSSILNHLTTTVTDISSLGSNQKLLTLKLQDQSLKAIITSKSFDKLAITKQMPLIAHIKSVALASDYLWQTDNS